MAYVATTSRLLKRVKTFKLENHVKIIIIIPEEVKVDILRRAKIYLHPMKYEHFEIAVVKAMAASLVPVVHKSGGS